MSQEQKQENQLPDDDILLECEKEFGENTSIKAMVCAITKTLVDNSVCTEEQIYGNLEQMIEILKKAKKK